MLSPRRSLLVSMSVVALALAACTSTPLPPDQSNLPPVPPQPVPPAQPTPPAPTTPAPPAQPAPPAKLQMVPATFAQLPGWDRDDLRAAWPAFMSSCSVLIKQAPWKEPCTVARTVNGNDEKAIRTYFEAFLEPNQVVAPDGATDGLITGYYEPLLHGARKKGGPYQTCRTIC